MTRGRVPKNFWLETVNWGVHILNRSLTFAVQNMTPEKAWSGRKPDMNHFKNFGCISFAHVPDQKKKKLDDKAEKCVFIGVSETSKAYKLFNPSTKKIVTSKDVVFDEENIGIGNNLPKYFLMKMTRKDKLQPLVHLKELLQQSLKILQQTMTMKKNYLPVLEKGQLGWMTFL